MRASTSAHHRFTFNNLGNVVILYACVEVFGRVLVMLSFYRVEIPRPLPLCISPVKQREAVAYGPWETFSITTCIKTSTNGTSPHDYSWETNPGSDWYGVLCGGSQMTLSVEAFDIITSIKGAKDWQHGSQKRMETHGKLWIILLTPCCILLGGRTEVDSLDTSR